MIFIIFEMRDLKLFHFYILTKPNYYEKMLVTSSCIFTNLRALSR